MTVGIKVAHAHSRLVALGKTHPEWVEEARLAIQPWENQEELLLGAVAVALRKAYEQGARGEYPSAPATDTGVKMIRRTRTPVVTVTNATPKLVRRRR